MYHVIHSVFLLGFLKSAKRCCKKKKVEIVPKAVLGSAKQMCSVKKNEIMCFSTLKQKCPGGEFSRRFSNIIKLLFWGPITFVFVVFEEKKLCVVLIVV